MEDGFSMNTDPHDQDGRSERSCMLLLLALFMLVILIGAVVGFLTLVSPD